MYKHNAITGDSQEPFSRIANQTSPITQAKGICLKLNAEHDSIKIRDNGEPLPCKRTIAL